MNYIFNNKEQKDKLLERFLRYAKIWSESNGVAADGGKMPSTEQQWDFARALVKELRNFGTRDVYLTDDCYVFGKIESNIYDKDERNAFPRTLLMAHMDTVDEVSGKNVKPQVLCENEDTIIRSDGTTLLGADDKAGIAAIMTAVEYIMDKDLPHGDIEVMFSPDEETGHGMDKVPMKLIKADRAYTVDGGAEGELESECFNAWSGSVKFSGFACHTGDAKAGKMVNANLILSDFIAKLPENMRPETTENYEGFIAVMKTDGSIEESSVELLLRSFNLEEIEKEKKIILEAANEAALKFGGKAEVSFSQQYLNMKDKISLKPEVIEKLEKAYEAAGVKIIRKPIRGGTDGSRLTEMGIPTPNIFTGGHNFHSRDEWLSLNQCSKSADVIINLLCGR